MAEFSFKIEVNAPVDVVFDIYADPVYENKWKGDLELKELISGKADEVGARFKCKHKDIGSIKDFFVIEELYSYKKNEEHAVRIRDKDGEESRQVKFHQEEDLTIMEVTLRCRNKNFLSRISKDYLFMFIHKRVSYDYFQKLKRIIEA